MGWDDIDDASAHYNDPRRRLSGEWMEDESRAIRQDNSERGDEKWHFLNSFREGQKSDEAISSMFCSHKPDRGWGGCCSEMKEEPDY